MKSIYRFLSPKFKTLFSEYKVDFAPRYGHGKPPHAELNTIIDANREEYKSILQEALKYTDKIHEIKKAVEEGDPNKPGWNNGMLPGLDIVGIYTMLAMKKPKRYIEVGSGNSTKVAYKAKMDCGLDTEIISIDPMPRAEIDQLTNKIIREPFENINYDEVLNLEAGEILFIDNSHRILPNSDAMVFFMEILPRLKKGVIVHIHDIYLPYDYPQFMCDRFYTEQYGLAMYILANPEKYATILPNYFISEDPELSRVIAPIWEHLNLVEVERHGGSYWLEIR
ncbi:MAG: class I SAM-dependent methyltransferase [Crocinitomicaceae bacterium]|mgnify:FL=1|nr:class I SAM-dependent methyltransferase [Crocinitomicaceae bacterium]MDG1657405.1 class I SAM-dependent methyltransferase [Crocinitomicaceae bacterium]|tara:strand:- start:1291 stop:2133 length:843 start_codon:yes stop_codon:yes gene_type:complete